MAVRYGGGFTRRALEGRSRTSPSLVNLLCKIRTGDLLNSTESSKSLTSFESLTVWDGKWVGHSQMICLVKYLAQNMFSSLFLSGKMDQDKASMTLAQSQHKSSLWEKLP